MNWIPGSIYLVGLVFTFTALFLSRQRQARKSEENPILFFSCRRVNRIVLRQTKRFPPREGLGESGWLFIAQEIIRQSIELDRARRTKSDNTSVLLTNVLFDFICLEYPAFGWNEQKVEATNRTKREIVLPTVGSSPPVSLRALSQFYRNRGSLPIFPQYITRRVVCVPSGAVESVTTAAGVASFSPRSFLIRFLRHPPSPLRLNLPYDGSEILLFQRTVSVAREAT